jgi:hypothetical protein
MNFTTALAAAAANPGALPPHMSANVPLMLVVGVVIAVAVFVLSIRGMDGEWIPVLLVALILGTIVAGIVGAIVGAIDGGIQLDRWMSAATTYLKDDFDIRVNHDQLTELAEWKTVIVERDGKEVAIKFAPATGRSIGVLTTGDQPLEPVSH